MWQHSLCSCSSSLMGIKAWCCHILPNMASQQSPSVLLTLSKQCQMSLEDLAGFWLIIMSLQLFNIKPLMSCINSSQVHKRTLCINWYCECTIWPALHVQNMTSPCAEYDLSIMCTGWPALHVLLLFTAAELLQTPKLVPVYTILCSCWHKGVFLQFSDHSGKRKTKWEE